METIDPGTLILTLTIAGGVILLLFGVIGFFLKTVHGDVRRNTGECGKNKGQLELIRQKQESDLKLVQETTQLEIRNMAEKVGELSTNVNTLVTALAEKALKDNE